MDATRPSQTFDLYQRLKVSREAPPEQITAGFKSSALKWHPNSRTGTEEDYAAVNQAYAILSDPINRRLYDEHLKNSSGMQFNLEERLDLIKLDPQQRADYEQKLIYLMKKGWFTQAYNLAQKNGDIGKARVLVDKIADLFEERGEIIRAGRLRERKDDLVRTARDYLALAERLK